MPDPYTYPGTDVLKNKFNIRDSQVLSEKENDLVYINLVTADQFLEGKDFSAETLKELHHYLFSDLYEWAGQFRTINIRKAERVLDGMSVEYTDYARLEQEAERIINNFQEKHWQDFEPEECADMLTKCFAALWKLHPFREGNTRTISTFVLHFIQTEGIEIDAFMFAKYSSYVRDSLVMASIEPYQEYEHLYKIVLDAMAGNEKPIMKSGMEEQYTHINGYDVKDYHYEPFKTEE